MRIVIALGGNALLRRGDPMTTEVQRRNIKIAAEALSYLNQQKIPHPPLTADDVYLGRKQGSGAHLSEIERTAVGEFTIDQAIAIEELERDARAGKFSDRVIRIENLLPDLPKATVLPVIEKRVKHGAKFNLSLAQIQPGSKALGEGVPAQLDSGEWKPSRLRVFNQQGHLIAIAEPVVPRTYQPVLVLDTTP